MAVCESLGGLEFKHQVSSLASMQARVSEGSILVTGRLCLGNLGWLGIRMMADQTHIPLTKVSHMATPDFTAGARRYHPICAWRGKD